jgi:hypothetical protein
MSASTPEGKIKKKINKILDKYKVEGHMYSYMPVPGGYGKATLDYLGFFYGLGFAIEAKRPDKKPTSRQEVVIKQIRESLAQVFIINDDESLTEFEDWLQSVSMTKSWLHSPYEE